MNNIKKSVALLLCDKIRQENSGRWYTWGGLTCWSCMRSSKGNPAKMRMRKKKGYLGCRLVNGWYTTLTGSKAKERLRKLN